jgi:hypothetical protein
VNAYPRPIHIFALFAFLGVPVAASAGEMGTMSRGTVSIRITIPPHVRIASGGDLASTAASSMARPLCIATNGLAHYRVALLSPAGAVQDNVSSLDRAAKRARTVPDGACVATNADGSRTNLSIVELAGSGTEPPTLLIVPE